LLAATPTITDQAHPLCLSNKDILVANKRIIQIKADAHVTED
jgi:hypothetical protein